MGIGFIKIGREDHEYLVLLPAMPNATHNSPTKSERGIGAHSGYRTGRHACAIGMMRALN